MNIPIKITNGVASINLNMTRQLTPKQLITLENTRRMQGNQDADAYLSTLLGLTKGSVDIRRLRRYQMPSILKTYAVLYYTEGAWHVFREFNTLDEAFASLIECAGTMCTVNVRVIQNIKSGRVDTCV